MATRLYLHNEVNTLSGTFPAGETDTQAPSFTAVGANTLKAMSRNVGNAMVGMTADTLASTSNQAGFMGMWVSPPVNSSQSIGGVATSVSINVADLQSELGANFLVNRIHAYVWRPSTGVSLGDVCSYSSATGSGSPAEANSSNSIQVTKVTINLSASSINMQVGDVIIVELWANFTQDTAVSRSVGIYFDGATENQTENAVVSDHASYIEFSQNFTFTTPPARLTSQSVQIYQDETVAAKSRLTAQSALLFQQEPQDIKARLTNQSIIVFYIPPTSIDGGAFIDISAATSNLDTQIQLSGESISSVIMVDNGGALESGIALVGESASSIEAFAELRLSQPDRFRTKRVTTKIDIDFYTQSAATFYGEIRKFAERTKSWQEAIFYETNPIEVWDPTIISRRVYGYPDEFLAVIASAGIDMFDQPLKQMTLTLPTLAQLNIIKRATNFESIYELRENFKPVWL